MYEHTKQCLRKCVVKYLNKADRLLVSVYIGSFIYNKFHSHDSEASCVV